MPKLTIINSKKKLRPALKQGDLLTKKRDDGLRDSFFMVTYVNLADKTQDVVNLRTGQLCTRCEMYAAGYELFTGSITLENE